MRRRRWGLGAGLTSLAVLVAVLVPLRHPVTVSTDALVLIVPVVLGVAVGGFVAGAVTVIAGFLALDYFFIPPYGTLEVSTGQYWVALAVYAVVMLLVAQIVDALDVTRREAHRGREVMSQISAVSESLVADQPVEDLLRSIVTTAQAVLRVPGVALLQLNEGRLVVVASAGEPLTEEDLAHLDPGSGRPVHVGTDRDGHERLRTVALSTSGRAVAMLALRGEPAASPEREVLYTFANDAALALERAQLRDQALRTHLLEEADRFRHGLMGAVSHDLRTPLATIKVASSTLVERGASLPAADVDELHHLIEVEADRLTRMVANLLDLSRLEAGVLTLHRGPTKASELVDDALSAVRSTIGRQRVAVEIDPAVPALDVDRTLMTQVVVNLLDNALRHGPPTGTVTIAVERRDREVVLSVADEGPGVPESQRGLVFDRFTQFDTGGRAGLGLTIARTFVEAHGQRIWYEEAPGGGARFCLTLPVVEEG
jgi:K+-sensing histidine kinase KdpD